MRIGELASRAGVSVRSLRYYEQQGLLTSTRSPAGQRMYTEGDVERVQLLQHLYAAGLPSRAIVEVLPCVDAPNLGNADAALGRLEQVRDRLSERIAELMRTRDALDELMARSREHREQLRTTDTG